MNFKTIALLASALFLSACARQPADPATGRVETQVVTTETLARVASFEIEREFAGLVLPRQSTDIAFERAGEIVEILVDEGDSAAPGDVIARLDTELLATERRELEARLDELAARATLNEANLDRALELQDRGFAAEQQIDELTTVRSTIAANQARVKAALAANAERLEQSVLRTPFGGVVSRRFVDDGAVVAGGTPVLRILETGELEARVGVPVRLHDAFAVGDTVEIRAAGRGYEGTVLAVGSDVTRATLTVPVRIAIAVDGAAVPGDQAWLRFDDRVEQAGYWIPVSALTDGLRGLWNVYVLAVDGGAPEAASERRLEARDVRILYSDEERAFVDGALADGEQIVAGGLQRLVPGQRVTAALTASGGATELAEVTAADLATETAP